MESKTCTYRPSLSSKDEISRNIVGLMEIEPDRVIAYIMPLTYTKVKANRLARKYKIIIKNK